jgi:hypothetical protein
MRTLAMLSLFSLFAARSAAEFPAPKDLPSRPELPDPLVMMDGTKVTTKEQWTEKRRPELKALFQHYMYGTIPPAKAVTAKVLHEDAKAFGGKATLREVNLSAIEGHDYRLLVVVPNGSKAPSPCFIGPNFTGNHTLVDDPKVALTTAWLRPTKAGAKEDKATDAARGKNKSVWNLEQSIDRGYAVATFYYGEVDADHAAMRTGIRPLLPKDMETTSIACWAWGMHRAVDYLSTLKDQIDAKRLIAVGHSRLGKTALLAAAFDERIAMAIPLQAGCGGTAPSRGKVGESVKQINDRFPHWFNANFKQFNNDPTRLPFDQHCLVALCAPRPVLFPNAKEDTWANPDGQFEVLRAADPVYRFLDAGGLDAKEVPPLGKLVDSKLGYFIREGRHSMSLVDWQAFWDFADKQLGRP